MHRFGIQGKFRIGLSVQLSAQEPAERLVCRLVRIPGLPRYQKLERSLRWLLKGA